MTYHIGQDKRLLQVTLPGLKSVSCYITEFSGVEAVSKPFAFKATVYFQGKVDLRELLGHPVIVTIAKGDETRLFHSCITKAYDSPTHLAPNSQEMCCELQLSPFTYYMDKNQDCRVFENLSVIEIAKQLCYERMYYDIELTKVKNTYPKIAHAVQYNETDFAFLQRLLAYYGVNYYFEHQQDGHYLTLIDDKSALPGMGALSYQYLDATNADFTSWKSSYKLMPNKAMHRSLNPDSPTRVVECTNINKEAYAKSLLKGCMEQEFYIQTFDPVNDVPRLNKQQLDYWNRMQRTHSGETTKLCIKLANVFKLDHKSQSQKNINYIITEISHEAKDNTHRVTGTDNSVTQQYKNKLICYEKDDGIVPEPNYNMPKISGVQSSFITGRKSQQPNTQDTMQTQLRHVWDRKSDSTTYPLNRVRVASPIASNQYGNIIQPRAESEVLTQFIDGNPANPVVIGGMYNKKQPPVIKTQENPLHNVIRTKTLGGTADKQHNEIHFIDNPGNEKIYIHAANKYITGIAQEAESTIGGDYTHHVKGDHNIAATDSITHTSFQKITLNAGTGKIEILPNQINITANLLKAGNPGSPAICAMDSISKSEGASPLDTVPLVPMKKNKLEYPSVDVPLDSHTLNTAVVMTYMSPIQMPIQPKVYAIKVTTSGSFSVLKNELVNPDTFEKNIFYDEACQAVADLFKDIEPISDKYNLITFENKNIHFEIDVTTSPATKQVMIKQVYQDYYISGLLNCQIELNETNNTQQLANNLDTYQYIRPVETAKIIEQTIDLGTMQFMDKTLHAQMKYEGTVKATTVDKVEKASYNKETFSQQVNDAVDEMFKNFKMHVNMNPNANNTSHGSNKILSVDVSNQVNHCKIKLISTFRSRYPYIDKYEGSKTKTFDNIINGIKLSVEETILVIVEITSNRNDMPAPKTMSQKVQTEIITLTEIGVAARLLIKIAQVSVPTIRFLAASPGIEDIFIAGGDAIAAV